MLISLHLLSTYQSCTHLRDDLENYSFYQTTVKRDLHLLNKTNVADSRHDSLVVLRGMRNAWPPIDNSGLEEAFAAHQRVCVRTVGETDTMIPLIRLTTCIMCGLGQLISFSAPPPPLFPDALSFWLYVRFKIVRLDDSLSQDRAILNLFL